MPFGVPARKVVVTFTAKSQAPPCLPGNSKAIEKKLQVVKYPTEYTIA
jgi:hypothetical protein